MDWIFREIDMRSGLILLMVLALSAATACEGSDSAAEPDSITVDQLAAGMQKAQITPCDSNGTSTRKKHGVVPGAVLLSSYSEYAISELPADKSRTLAFYCSSAKCSAAPKAATKAIAAGYSDVRWLKVGIKGWKAAGQKTQVVPGG